jgi:hypothetical protein
MVDIIWGMANTDREQPPRDDALDKAKADWTRDLRPLLPQLVSWKDAASQIEPVLRTLVA